MGQNLRTPLRDSPRGVRVASTVVDGRGAWPSMRTRAKGILRVFVRVEPPSAATKIAKSSFPS